MKEAGQEQNLKGSYRAAVPLHQDWCGGSFKKALRRENMGLVIEKRIEKAIKIVTHLLYTFRNT
ncbi:MAG: hypothetical protein MRZ54_03280 [Clostridiales bacterium]|nr:hypothetical protein [Clostridiales bacterium]